MKRKISLFLASLAIGCGAMAATDGYELTAPDVVEKPGWFYLETIFLDNENPVLGFQCDIDAEDGITIDTSKIKVSERAANHTLRATRLDSGVILVTILNLDAEPITGESGPLFSIPMTLPQEEGEYSIDLSYIVLSVQGVGRVQLPNTTIPVTVDKTTSVDLPAGEEAPVEWYDLRGYRIENPTSGIYIRRQGREASLQLLTK